MLRAVSNCFIPRIMRLPLYAFCANNKSAPAPPTKEELIINSFTDQLEKQKDKERPITYGRSWKASELRLKSNEDLHKLWFVCVKEKNLVLADELAMEQNASYVRKAGKIRRIEKLEQTMSRILHVIAEREKIRKDYRAQLEQEYIDKKRAELAVAVSKGPAETPKITQEMLRAKYEALRKGKDNIEYLEHIFKRNEESTKREERANERALKLDPSKEFTSFWQQQMSIGERPTQTQVLRAHVKNWKSLNLKQRKIILGFLNARRSKDAKSTFVKELKILGQKIAQQQAKERTINSA